MWKSLSFKIALKLPAAVLGAALLVSAGVGVGCYAVGAGAVSQLTERQLATLAHERAVKLSEYLSSVQSDLVATATFSNTIDAIDNIVSAWQDIPDGPMQTLQKSYIEDNPNPQATRYLFDAPTTFLRYNFAHKRFHPQFRAQMLARGYDDMYLFDTAGNMIYSVAKQADFATNFAAGGASANTSLGEVFRAAMAAPKPGVVSIADFSKYAPGNGLPASFLATPVFDAKGTKTGVLAIRLGLERVDAIMQERRGLGDTGETIAVGPHGGFRSDSTFAAQPDALTTSLINPAVDAALGGTHASGQSKDYRGMLMNLEIEPVAFSGIQWAVVAIMSADEVLAPERSMRNAMFLIGGALLASVAVAGLIFSRSITRPISRLTSIMKAIAEGDFEHQVSGGERRDELGEMAKAVEVFRENGLKVREMTDAEHASANRRRIDRAQMMQVLQSAFGEVVDAAIAGDFSKRVGESFPDGELNALAKGVNKLVETVDRGLTETSEVLGALAETDLTNRVNGHYEGAFARLKSSTNAVAENLTEVVTRLRETSRSLRTATGEILSGSNDLAARTTKQAMTVDEIGAAMRQLNGQVLESSQRAKAASKIAATVAGTAEQGGAVMRGAKEAMERITSSSSQISNITGMIDDIAFQTNLLALNASVEAARAGDAGDGFAVVAVEVRRLAQSAAQASRDIKALVEQSAHEVTDGSRLVSEAASNLATMMEAARANTEFIDGIVREGEVQATNIGKLTKSVQVLDEMTQHNSALVEQTNVAIEQTETQAGELDRIVDVFTLDSSSPQRTIADEPSVGRHQLGSVATQQERATSRRDFG